MPNVSQNNLQHGAVFSASSGTGWHHAAVDAGGSDGLMRIGSC